MPVRVRIMAACLLLPFFMAEQVEGRGAAVYRAVEFRGLKYISKAEIARSAGFRGVAEGVLVDRGLLKKALSKNPAVRKFSVNAAGERLVITVVEKTPLIVGVLTRGKGTLLFELDDTCSIITESSVRAWDVPYVHIPEAEIDGTGMSSRVRAFCRLMVKIRVSEPAFYSEISEIFLHGDYVEVMMKKRKTRFQLRPERACFERLKYMAGYLDRIRYYPDSLEVTGDRVLIR